MTKPLDQPRPTLRASVVAVPPRHRFTACIGRLSAAVGTGRARCLWKAAAVCWAEVLPFLAADACRALGPMLLSSAREPWPFFVLRDSCHAALPDQPGLPSIGSGRRTGGSRRHPRLPRLVTDYYCMDPSAAWPCCVAVFQSNRKSAAQTAFMHACLEIEPSRAVCVRLCAYRQRAEHSGRLRSCRHA
eukprot:COSAG02_NODE_83_length_39665_cov_25.213719_25_plen_188_part_00